MIETLASSSIALVIALALTIFFKGENDRFLKVIGLVTIYHLLYVTLLYLPIEVSSMYLGTMNWSGKMIAFGFSILFYFLTKDSLEGNDYVSSIPEKDRLKKVVAVGLITVAVMCLLTFMFSSGKPMEIEKLMFQLTMPGLDEELWRGILLGLLILVTKEGKFKFGHPALWTTTIIFSLGHSLYFQNWELGFAVDAFIVTGVLGFILGWMTLTTRSILPAIIFHNLINFSTNILEMSM